LTIFVYHGIIRADKHTKAGQSKKQKGGQNHAMRYASFDAFTPFGALLARGQ